MCKALIVDDSRTIRMILRRILSELGFEVAEAGNGREALEMLTAGLSDVGLLLADWNMPEMNGYELLVGIRQHPEFSNLRVIMVTTEAELGHMASALSAGADEYIMKPFTKEILVQKLDLIGALQPASA